MATYIATVHMLFECDSDDEAADTVSALLTENGKYDPECPLLDWSYAIDRAGCYASPTPIILPEGFDPDEVHDFERLNPLELRG